MSHSSEKFNTAYPIPAHLDRQFAAARKRAGSTKIRFHDLRHTFASHFMMNGGNIYDLQKILGHSSVKMTERYAHLSPNHLSDAMKIVSFSGDPEQDSSKIVPGSLSAVATS
jgi:integrase